MDPAQTLWVWITSLLTRMAADGEIPPMASPTYGRVITMAEQAPKRACGLSWAGVQGDPGGARLHSGSTPLCASATSWVWDALGPRAAYGGLGLGDWAYRHGATPVR